MWDTAVKLSTVKSTSSDGVDSLVLSLRSGRPCSDELCDERLGCRPSSSSLADLEWAVLQLLGLEVIGSRLKSSTWAPPGAHSPQLRSVR